MINNKDNKTKCCPNYITKASKEAKTKEKKIIKMKTKNEILKSAKHKNKSGRGAVNNIKSEGADVK